MHVDLLPLRVQPESANAQESSKPECVKGLQEGALPAEAVLAPLSTSKEASEGNCRSLCEVLLSYAVSSKSLPGDHQSYGGQCAYDII